MIPGYVTENDITENTFIVGELSYKTSVTLLTCILMGPDKTGCLLR